VIEFKLTGVDQTLALLQSLPPEIVSKRGGPVKAALAKGARFLRDHVKTRLAAAIAVNGQDSSGLLLSSIIATRGRMESGEKGERYLIRVKRKRYPRKGRAVTTRQAGAHLEFGTSQQPATPWMRPTLLSQGHETIMLITTDLNKRIERILKRLKKRGR
jgi:hypothetical protein